MLLFIIWFLPICCIQYPEKRMSFPENSSSSFVASLWTSNTKLLGIQLVSLQLNCDSDALPQCCICKCSTLCWGCIFRYLVLSHSCRQHLVPVCCSSKQHYTVRTMSEIQKPLKYIAILWHLVLKTTFWISRQVLQLSSF